VTAFAPNLRRALSLPDRWQHAGITAIAEMAKAKRNLSSRKITLGKRAPQRILGRCLLAVALLGLAPGTASAADETVELLDIAETKAVFGRVETRNVVPARARIEGTLTTLGVTEGSAVTVGQPIAMVTDDKLALRLGAADARVKAMESELGNARNELNRAAELLARGASTQQRVDQLRTQTEILLNQAGAARAERAVISQQATEGTVLSPATGRVLRTPVTPGAVIMPGDSIADIAGGGFFLRLAIPERHAAMLSLGSFVLVAGRGETTQPREGRLVKIFPQIENGRVIADVEVPNLGDFFVGERLSVRVPVSVRKGIAIPPSAITIRSGIDFVRLLEEGKTREVAVIRGSVVTTAKGPRVEILTGLTAGDRILLP
jgi:RND family efflux transporter MFP subunit